MGGREGSSSTGETRKDRRGKTHRNICRFASSSKNATEICNNILEEFNLNTRATLLLKA